MIDTMLDQSSLQQICGGVISHQTQAAVDSFSPLYYHEDWRLERPTDGKMEIYKNRKLHIFGLINRCHFITYRQSNVALLSRERDGH